jgi:GNAT superfamily N-acetyltransferase
MLVVDIQVIQASPSYSEVIAEFNQMMTIETEGRKLPWGKIHPGINAIL